MRTRTIRSRSITRGGEYRLLFVHHMYHGSYLTCIVLSSDVTPIVVTTPSGDPYCRLGHLDNDASDCCAHFCTQCGGSGCSGAGGASSCCTSHITRSCNDYPPPCELEGDTSMCVIKSGSSYAGTYELMQTEVNGDRYWKHESQNKYIYNSPSSSRWFVSTTLGNTSYKWKSESDHQLPYTSGYTSGSSGTAEVSQGSC